ncbi:DnaA N-terminal domain-containing protein [Candidatus Chloroploca sp. Khr17]|uniref:DnaA N-terminal domain-containing protein n=1 Tax=Candidatus Chloroploca sp. Khr17 TaxID=2496869 RepID=UPI00101E17D0|nr:DnaA N-terminal domain-containing protein [Candidatus Chloroploca sp. Khr17]
MIPSCAQTTTGRRRTDTEFEAMLELDLRNSPAKQRAMRRLRRLMDANGKVVLRGGVRGWMVLLDCGASRPRWLLEELAACGLITLEIKPERGRILCAEVAVRAAFDDTADAAAPVTSTGVHPRMPTDPLAEAGVDHPNHHEAMTNSSNPEAPVQSQANQGERLADDVAEPACPTHKPQVTPTLKPTVNPTGMEAERPRAPNVQTGSGSAGFDPSRIDPPPHPPMWKHESMQQQHGRTQSEEPGGISFVQRLLQAFPEADRALLTAWANNPLVNECAAALAALQGFPTATLAAWQQDLAAARSRANIVLPEGLVLACWSRGERVNAARMRPSAPQGSPHQPHRRSPQAPPRAYDADRVRAQLTLPAASANDPAEGVTAEEALAGHALGNTEPSALAEPAPCAGAAQQPMLRTAAPGQGTAGSHLGDRDLGDPAVGADDQSVQRPAQATMGSVGHDETVLENPLAARQAWQATLALLREACSRQEFDTWLRATRLIGLDDGLATIQAPTEHLVHLQARYQRAVQRALCDVLGRPIQVQFVA